MNAVSLIVPQFGGMVEATCENLVSVGAKIQGDYFG